MFFVAIEFGRSVFAIPMGNVAELLRQAFVLHQSGDAGGAESLYRKVLAYDRGNVRALSMLGLARIQQGDAEEGIKLMASSLDINPVQPDVLNNLGYSLQLQGKLKEALARFDQAIALVPNYTGAHFNRGNTLHDMARYEEAVASYGRAISLRPDYADAYVNQGNSLRELKRHDEALACYDKALAVVPLRADIHFNRGLTLQDMGRNEEALASFDQVIALDPDWVDAHTYRASVLMDRGLLAEAEESLKQALKLDANHLPSHVMLSTLGSYDEHDPGFGQLCALYERREQLSPAGRVDLGFAMGKVLEKMGRFDEGFNAYLEGNRLYRSLSSYDDRVENEVVDKITSFFTADLFAKCAKASGSLDALPDDRVPVFIVGMPRSGTTLIEQVLASHPAVFGAGEMETLHGIVQHAGSIQGDSSAWGSLLSSFREMGQDYLEKTWRLAPDFHYISDKMPPNYRYLGLIHLMLPNAKIIHAMRDPMDTCFSCYATLFKEQNDFSYDLETLGRHYLRYARLMEYWHDVLPAGRILNVRYEDVVSDLESEARRMLDYLGLPWDDACLRFYENRRAVRTASLSQVRKPIYSASVGRWKRFEKYLGPLQEIIIP